MKSVIALALLFSVNAYANNWYDRGNGGFVIQCGDQKPQVLDLFESTTRFNLPIMATTATTAEEKAKELISRLAEKDPQRARQLNIWLEAFKTESQMVSGSFSKTPDLGAVVIPTGCELQQVIVQQQPSVVNAYRYQINTALWNQLDADNQAALMVHELIYREFITTPSQEFSSERIRYFNAFIHAGLPGVHSLADYIAKLQEVHMVRYQYNDLMLFLGAPNGTGDWIVAPLTFDGNNHVLSASLYSVQTIKRPYFTYSCVSNDGNPRLGAVTLYANGAMAAASIDESAITPTCPLPSFLYSFYGSTFIVAGNNWQFDSTDQVSRVQSSPLINPMRVEYKGNLFVSPDALSFLPPQGTIFRFDDKMNVIELGLGGSVCKVPDAKTYNFLPGLVTWDNSVLMDKDGKTLGSIKPCY